ncbi:hypothetical protein CASFOL_041231 [Castilleja foliolosa]|uniref:F-box domain-containing protein n=1 Tax=Castilleja foliolosa TaxID=1961234 RepID=A0ABD3BDW3_9LAMI
MLKTTNIESLPDETLFEILVRVPAQDICNASRFVCRKWYQIIRTREFVHAHLKQSTLGLLIHHMASKNDGPIFVSTQKGEIEISNINYKLKQEVLSSCNGLILECRDKSRRYDLCITNPVTKQRLSLPPFLPNTRSYSSTIAYVFASTEYKLVHPFYDDSKARDEIAILTVGVDTDWTRRVSIQHLYQSSKNDIPLLNEKPLCTEGFVHWVERRSVRAMRNPEYVLTLNIETEIVTQFRFPFYCESSLYYYLTTGSHLTLLIASDVLCWDVWEMKSETGEWKNVMIIDLEPEKDRFASVARFEPVGWLNFGEVLVFSLCIRTYSNIPIPNKFCVAYNVRTDEIIGAFCTAGFNKFAGHRNSLVWF